MAKPKQTFLVEEYSNTIAIWANNPVIDFIEIKRIEGVSTILMLDGNPIRVCVDPRYDQKEVAEEIRELLAAEVPDVFKEE